ncbi:4-(cytidine 5'-diphospho)-2-C-methyl-D-erythritol kinase [Rhodoferax sp.]|uniref:4-(cytidine 5'-diphospho)-2-C-methyl-D-erythritol kinase n=1 Tax=Rhodoferax sp. TaxID=50421 RepID=UPI001EBAE06C|nr:4-(cytidine 5'-diphospho)-2-C-methyl-D-erythritol kinase [Rhodoferax sp.]MBT9505495.1 4-(cytidine 5'-diphospho)-2-C-methyl-D-erythritol kinase [Rhodoferax sp.]
MKSLYDVSAPAKLNLFLHITGRREDGYHLLQSVFMLIDWCDTLHFDLRADGRISREDLITPLPADDLIVRAAGLLKAASNSPHGVHIAIEKRIPAQAGMGGGSSDAASTLLALNRLWQLDYSVEKLIQIGLQLGADVPFFLGGHNAWVEGIGEKMTPVTLPKGRFLVVKPAQGLDTRLIFSDPLLKRDSKTAIISGFAANAFSFGRNDLQSVAQRLCPGVTQALDWLASCGLDGRMTGSGSAVFAQVLQDIDLSNVPRTFVVRLCNNLAVHPLVGWAASDNMSEQDIGL